MPATHRLIAALIAAAAWTGLGTQLAASIALTGDPALAVWAMLRYFTVLTNLLVAVTFTALAFGSRVVTPPRLAGVTIAIMLVGIVYHLLLRGMVELSGGARLADTLNHSVTPVLVTLYWLFLAQKGHLSWRMPLAFAAYPLAYFGYALVRGGFEGIYAYPFLDVAKLGWQPVLITAIGMALGFLVTGYMMTALDRHLAR